jgi:hypothetical protein
MKQSKMVIESEELPVLARAKFIAAQVAIKKFGWAHHMLLLGSKRMQKLDVIGIHLVGNLAIAERQR